MFVEFSSAFKFFEFQISIFLNLMSFLNFQEPLASSFDLCLSLFSIIYTFYLLWCHSRAASAEMG